MSQKHEISCWKCHEMTSLETRNEFDGCCWACGEEIDLDDYLIKAMDKRDEHYAALSAVTAERDRLLQELAKSETNTMTLMVKHFAGSMSSSEQDRKLDECLSEGIALLKAERDRLQAALSAPDTITAEPAGDYDNLRKQFQSLRMLANSNAKMVHHWRAQCGRETRETLLANAASVNAERDTNSMLTDALETAERERDQLRAEVAQLRQHKNDYMDAAECTRRALVAEAEALRKDAERWRYVSLQGDDTHWLNLLRVDLDEFGGNINAAVDALIDGEAPAMAAKEA